MMMTIVVGVLLYLLCIPPPSRFTFASSSPSPLPSSPRVWDDHKEKAATEIVATDRTGGPAWGKTKSQLGPLFAASEIKKRA